MHLTQAPWVLGRVGSVPATCMSSPLLRTLTLSASSLHMFSSTVGAVQEAGAGHLHIVASAENADSFCVSRSSLHMFHAPQVLCRDRPLPATHMLTPLLYRRHRRGLPLRV